MGMVPKGGGKGFKGRQEVFKGRQADPMAMKWMEMQRLEMSFLEEAEMVYQSVVDLNQPRGMLEGMWRQLMNAREQLVQSRLQAISSPKGGKGKGGPKGNAKAAALPALAGPVNEEDVNWKQLLFTEYTKATGDASPHERFVYDVQEVPDGGKSPWLASLTVDDEVIQGEAMPSKKAAEKSASKVALQHFYPDAFARQAAELRKGVKRGAAAVEQPPSEESPKQRLMMGIGLMLDRSATKGDFSFEYDEIPAEEGAPNKSSNWICRVTLVEIDPETCYQGEICTSKKLAESSACAAAYEALKDSIEPLEVEHKAKKAKKEREKKEASKERFALKKQNEGLIPTKSESLR